MPKVSIPEVDDSVMIRVDLIFQIGNSTEMVSGLMTLGNAKRLNNEFVEGNLTLGAQLHVDGEDVLHIFRSEKLLDIIVHNAVLTPPRA